MIVADLMTRDVVTVGPEDTLREVASVLVTEHIGGVPVVAGEEVVGIVSATDLLDFDADAPGSPAERVEQHTGFGESAEDLAADVADGDEAPAAYFVELWDDVGGDVVHRFEQVDSPEWNVLDEHVASEVMTTGIHAVSPSTGMVDAARHMLERDVHRLLVLEDGRLVGVLSSLDFVRAVAERSLGG